MESLTDLIGEWVIDSRYEAISTEELKQENKIIGLYFSGIYPAGREFTSFLVAFYNRFHQASIDNNGKQLEIVFVSCDEREEMFYVGLSEMPWYSIPFTDSQLRVKLIKRYNIVSIPSLVLLDGFTGQLITTEARNALCDDPNGRFFPWAKRSLSDVLAGELMKGEARQDIKELISGETVKGFYFAANWCKPCRKFTPWLKDIYETVKADEKDFEIIFVSLDRSEPSFLQHYKTMPWLAIPFNDQRIKELILFFNIHGIPCFVTLDGNDEIINCNCRSDMMKDKVGKNFPWTSPTVEELNEETCCLDETVCLILFTAGDKKLIDGAHDLLSEPAEEYRTEQKGSRTSEKPLPKIRFLYEGPGSEDIADTVREMTQLDGFVPVIAIVDPHSCRTYSTADGDTSKEALVQLISDFKRLSQLPDEQVCGKDPDSDLTDSDSDADVGATKVKCACPSSDYSTAGYNANSKVNNSNNEENCKDAVSKRAKKLSKRLTTAEDSDSDDEGSIFMYDEEDPSSQDDDTFNNGFKDMSIRQSVWDRIKYWLSFLRY